ncbi:MAG TPA: UDP-galactopyranose mutase, partial [Terrimicrobiaceae bacterium]
HTERDRATGVMVHVFGPHIFHTDREDVWNYVNRFGTFVPFVNRVKASNSFGLFSFPINLHTINQFFGKRFSPKEARTFIGSLGDRTIGEPQNFEEQALKYVGRELYDAFFYHYTTKQWGCEPRELPASILKRLPVRFNYNDNYYHDAFQGIPEQGYSTVIERMLDDPHITVQTSVSYSADLEKGFDHCFYTGLLDAYFGFKLGRLSYRTVTFERIESEGDYQGNAVINYTDASQPFTRVHEHKHLAPWESHERTIAFREFSKETGAGDLPYYPKRLAADKTLLRKYRELAKGLSATSFLGRLGTYRYLDMDTVIGEALDFAATFAESVRRGRRCPVFPSRGGGEGVRVES